MRKVKESQMKLGEVNIANIKFDLRSRDEIPKLLMGLHQNGATAAWPAEKIGFPFGH